MIKPNFNRGKIISEFLEILMKDKAVNAVIYTGSYSQGYSDEYSDVDLGVFLNGKTKINEGKQVYKNIIFDLRFVDINILTSIEWSEDMYNAYVNSKIILDRSNEIRSLIKRKKIEWENTRLKKLKLGLVNLSVIYYFDDNWAGLKADSHFFKFIKRKDLISANRVLNNAFEIALDLAYLIEGRTIPDFKNKFSRLKLLKIFRSYRSLFAKAYLIKELNERNTIRRYSILDKIVNIFKKNLKEFEKQNLYKYYLENRLN